MKNKCIVLIVVLVISFALVACDGSGDGVKASCNPITDARDGQSYCTVTIGSQTWMAENLNYAMDGSYCYAGNPANCAEFGRLYTYEAAMRACPAGWHIPTRDEWWTLAESFNLSIPASQATGYEKWPNATDSYGFSIRPGGIRVPSSDSYESGILSCDSIYEGSCYKDKGLVAYFQVIDNRCTMDYSENMLGTCTLVCVSEECDASFLATNSAKKALSVRCIKGNGAEQTSSMDTSSFSNKSSSSTSMGTEFANETTGSMTDARDGQTYKIVKIGDQVWMAQNLNFKTDSSFCYDNEESNCTRYGRLYKWAAAKSVCPSGWHLPSKTEWETMFDSVGGSSIAGSKLKSTFGWDDFEGKSGNGTDDFGFSALPAGYWKSGGYYNLKGISARFWSSTKLYDNAYFMYLYYANDGVNLGDDSNGYGFSVRCVKD